MEHTVHKGIYGTVVILMDNKSVFLIHQQDIFVLIHHGDIRRGFKELILLFITAEKFIGQIQLQHIALGKSGRYLAALAVELDVFRAYALVHHALGQAWSRFLYELIHTLSCVIGIDNVFFHWLISSL